MAARIALLIIATGLFAAAWSGDHPPTASAAPRPVKQPLYPDDAIRETVLHRWKSPQNRMYVSHHDVDQPSVDVAQDQAADAWEAVRAAESADAVTIRIDWLGLGDQLRQQFAVPQPSARSQPLWHRLTSPVARILESQQQQAAASIAAEPSATVRK